MSLKTYLLILGWLGSTGAAPGASTANQHKIQLIDNTINTTQPQEKCTKEGMLSIEDKIEWFILGGAELPSATFTPIVTSEPCRSFVASSAADWLTIDLAPDGSALDVTVNPDRLRSGKLATTISIWDSNVKNTLAQILVSVWAIVSPPEGAKVHKRALIIGVDGLDGAEMYNSDTPALNHLHAGGLWTRDARTHWTGDTVSGPGWTSVLTGVEVVDHNITHNGGYEFRNRDYPTMMYKLKQAGYRTAASIQWTDIFDILEEDSCDASNRGNQQEVTDWVVERLQQETAPDDVIFVHLNDVDHAGHSHGFTAKNIHYVDAIEAADHNILEMIEAVMEGPNIANEEWLIIVSADHGGDERGSHGPMNADYRQIPLVISGPTTEKGLIPQGFGNHMDIHPTTLDFFGLDPYPEGMDGLSWLHPIKEGPAVIYKYTSNYEAIWNDHGSGAATDVSIWRPANYEYAFCSLGDVAVNQYDQPWQNAVLVKVNTPGVVHPTSFIKVWDDQSSGANMECSVFRMHAGPEYTCLGGIAIRSRTEEPDGAKYCCVKNDYIVPGIVEWVYDDHGSGAAEDLSLWAVKEGSKPGLEGSNFVPENGYQKPANGFLLNGDHEDVQPF